MATAQRHKGTVKWYDVSKGYGFITPDHGTEDVFLHSSALDAVKLRGVDEGQRLEYSIEPSFKPGGQPKACDIRKL